MQPVSLARLQIHFCVLLWGFTAILGKLITVITSYSIHYTKLYEKPTEWRTPDPDNLLVMTLAGGRRVLIELAPDFTPLHAANIRTLVHEHYFDGLAIIRVQRNNFV